MDSKPYSWVALDRNCTHHGHHGHHRHHDDCNYEEKHFVTTIMMMKMSYKTWIK